MIQTNKIKQYYTIKTEGTAPIEITYRILAEDHDEALKILEHGLVNPISIVPKPGQMRRKKAKVYKYGTTILMITKTY